MSRVLLMVKPLQYSASADVKRERAARSEGDGGGGVGLGRTDAAVGSGTVAAFTPQVGEKR